MKKSLKQAKIDKLEKEMKFLFNLPDELIDSNVLLRYKLFENEYKKLTK